LTSLSEHA